MGEDGRSLGVAGAFATEPSPVAPPESRSPLPSGSATIDPPTETAQIVERVDLTSPTRHIERWATGSPRPTTSTSRCASAPVIPSARSSERLGWAVRSPSWLGWEHWSSAGPRCSARPGPGGRRARVSLEAAGGGAVRAPPPDPRRRVPPTCRIMHGPARPSCRRVSPENLVARSDRRLAPPVVIRAAAAVALLLVGGVAAAACASSGPTSTPITTTASPNAIGSQAPGSSAPGRQLCPGDAD